jgi:hypothetical protein
MTITAVKMALVTKMISKKLKMSLVAIEILTPLLFTESIPDNSFSRIAFSE